ncbi:ferric-chelate reductase 1-like isoform X2 [Ptychodera flava]|uniref:ferric-chelate reductase 1-like isoform X2 n=1 Tax=Ptychodera flava TaxID=63121 RepID=UPI003969C764
MEFLQLPVLPYVSRSSVPAQTSASPYSLTVSDTSYSAGDEISVTLSGSNFLGFMVQARRADWSLDQNEPIGSFTDIPSIDNVQTKQCSNSDDTLSHMGVTQSTTPHTSLTVTWTAPSPSAGHVRFRATVAAAKVTFWTNIYSEIIEDPSAPTIGPTPTPPESVTGPSDLVTSDGCGTTKGCYQDPAGCSDRSDCNVLITWQEDGDNIIFQLLGKMEVTGNEYVAIGFSNDQSMGDDDVWGCVNNGGPIVLAHSYNTGKSNAAETLDGSSDAIGSFVDSVVQCQFTLEKTLSAKRRKRATEDFDLNDQYYLLIARGPKIEVSPPRVSKHSVTPIITTSKIDFTGTDVLSGGAGANPMLKAHASFMVLGWIGLASVAIILAKYFKPMWPNSTLMGQKVWFTFHRSLMMLNVLCFCIAFILIFVHVGGFVTYQKSSDTVFIHALLGILATSFGLANPIMAMFRPHPGTPKRPIFNWAHWAVGTIAHSLAFAAVFLGMDLAALDLPQYTTWVLVAYVVLYVIVIILLEVSTRVVADKEKKHEIPLKEPGSSSGDDDQEKPEPADSLIRTSLLGGFIFVTAVVVLLIIIVIALQ